ncbi:MAG: protein NO VEIN domain-containing protein [Solirubrobacteraceae bacterium]
MNATVTMLEGRVGIATVGLALGSTGTNAVIRQEEQCGHEPLPKPGCDVGSYVDGELERIIEIKSIDDPWDAARARLSKEQFKSANEHGDLHWLYVVEHARTSPIVWRIQDSGRRVHGFAYIPDWKRLAEPNGDAPSTVDEQ